MNVNAFHYSFKVFLRLGSNVPMLSRPFTVLDRLHERSMSVLKRSMIDFDNFRPFATILRPEMFRNGHETFRDAQKRIDRF
jgi:hypothetical protein